MKMISYIVVLLVMFTLVNTFTKVNHNVLPHNHVEHILSKSKKQVILDSAVEELKFEDSFVNKFLALDFKYELHTMIDSKYFSNLYSTSTNKICLLRRYVFGLPFI